MLLQSLIYRFVVTTTLLTAVSAHAGIIDTTLYPTSSPPYRSITSGYLLLAIATLNKDFRDACFEKEKPEYMYGNTLQPSDPSLSFSIAHNPGFDGDPGGDPPQSCLPFILNAPSMVINNRSSTLTVFMLHGNNDGEEEMEVDDDLQPSTSQGATASASNQGERGATTDFRDMSNYQARLDSFNGAPLTQETLGVPLEQLATWGFYYVGDSSLPERATLNHALRVTHYQSQSPIPESSIIQLIMKQNDLQGLDQMANQAGFMNVPEFLASMGLCHYLGRHPSFMCTSEERLATFASWPALASVSPQPLAEAGLFYTGSGDSTSFFGCDHGGLRNWQPGDDPWEEHAHFFPGCLVLRAQKSDEEIKKLVESRTEKYQTASHPLTQALMTEGFRISDIRRAFAVHKFFFDWNMNLDAISGNTKYYNSLRDWIRQDTQMRSEALASQASTSSGWQATGAEQTVCICTDQAPNIFFIPCGHCVCCQKCSPKVQECPVCRSAIDKRIQGEQTKGHPCLKCQSRRPNMLYIPCAHLPYCIQCSHNEEICPKCKGKATHKQKIFQGEEENQ